MQVVETPSVFIEFTGTREEIDALIDFMRVSGCSPKSEVVKITLGDHPVYSGVFTVVSAQTIRAYLDGKKDEDTSVVTSTS